MLNPLIGVLTTTLFTLPHPPLSLAAGGTPKSWHSYGRAYDKKFKISGSEQENRLPAPIDSEKQDKKMFICFHHVFLLLGLVGSYR